MALKVTLWTGADNLPVDSPVRMAVRSAMYVDDLPTVAGSANELAMIRRDADAFLDSLGFSTHGWVGNEQVLQQVLDEDYGSF